ncbi:hypothetical protein Q9Q99_19995 [Curtobacterium flaccumfaciens]|nr:hypothetical protein Q9Q99_19995 [Curtobacterium flaccumfaciens]
MIRQSRRAGTTSRAPGGAVHPELGVFGIPGQTGPGGAAALALVVLDQGELAGCTRCDEDLERRPG